MADEIHYRLKAFVGMVQQNIALADGGEDVFCFGQGRRQGGLVRRMTQMSGAGNIGETEKTASIQRSVNFVNILSGDIQLFL